MNDATSNLPVICSALSSATEVLIEIQVLTVSIGRTPPRIPNSNWQRETMLC
jgi:hypothetical protein